MQTNRDYAATLVFKSVCRKAGIKPTKRQASKFRMEKGYLFKATAKNVITPHLPKKARLEN